MACVASFFAHPGVHNAATAWAAQVVVFNVAAALFAWLDHTGARGQLPGNLVYKWKVIRDDPVTWTKALPVVLRNQFLILLPIMTLGAYFEFGFRANVSVHWWMFVVHAYILGVVHDVVFYFGHKFLHTKWAFHTLDHALHHTSKAGCAASAMYMAPVDFFVQIVAPYGAFLMLCMTDYRFDILLASIGSVAAMYEHSGYCFTRRWHALDTTMHFSHHLGRVSGSLSEGVLSPGYCDMIFGTKLGEGEFSNYQTEDMKKQS